jgi:hypothetical protein
LKDIINNLDFTSSPDSDFTDRLRTGFIDFTDNPLIHYASLHEFVPLKKGGQTLCVVKGQGVEIPVNPLICVIRGSDIFTVPINNVK